MRAQKYPIDQCNRWNRRDTVRSVVIRIETQIRQAPMHNRNDVCRISPSVVPARRSALLIGLLHKHNSRPSLSSSRSPRPASVSRSPCFSPPRSGFLSIPASVSVQLCWAIPLAPLDSPRSLSGLERPVECPRLAHRAGPHERQSKGRSGLNGRETRVHLLRRPL